MSTLGYSAEYHKGYSDGYRTGYLEATKVLPALAAKLLNPTPIVLSGVALQDIKEPAPTDAEHTEPKICAHFVQFEDCVFFPGDVSCGEKGCDVKERRLRASV